MTTGEASTRQPREDHDEHRRQHDAQHREDVPARAVEVPLDARNQVRRDGSARFMPRAVRVSIHAAILKPSSLACRQVRPLSLAVLVP